ncbi:MAG: hypothetical protein HFJ75_07395 [Eggerthellaceae bacterium]|nr:hypothetical protein [Eggerthellaceae bacterium]
MRYGVEKNTFAEGLAPASPTPITGEAPEARTIAAEAPRAASWAGAALSFLAAAGLSLLLASAMPNTAWASDVDGGDVIGQPAAQVSTELVVEGTEEADDIVEPKGALDDNDLPAQAAAREADAAATASLARAAEQAPASSDAAPAAAPATSQPARTVNVAGTVVSYVDSYKTASAPATGAGLWLGSDSTTDGSWGYFIGHNPGSFNCVMGLGNGAAVTVCDSSGNQRTYHVVDVFTVPDTTYWEDIQGRVSGYGESVILQTCVGDHASYRVVVAA